MFHGKWIVCLRDSSSDLISVRVFPEIVFPQTAWDIEIPVRIRVDVF